MRVGVRVRFFCMYHEIPEHLRALIEPVIDDHGLELVDADLAEGADTTVVRIVVDTPAGDGRVPVDRCAALSREIAVGLDARDELSERYQLEVASPGLHRVLAREKDFRAACGREVKVETKHALVGRKHFRGALRSFDGGVAELEVDGEAVQIPFDEVRRAHEVYEFSSADFAKPKGSKRSGRRERRRAAAQARRGGKS